MREADMLPGGVRSGPMPWVIAIMTFLGLLAASAALALGGAADRLEAGNRIIVQIIEADPAAREAQARRALTLMQGHSAVTKPRRVSDAELARLVEPWLGAGAEATVPIPAMIEADLAPGGNIEALAAALARAVPAARLDAAGAWLGPVASLVDTLRWLAAALVALAIAASAAVVVLAARAALDTHRPTIELLHLLGATDAQLARLFQRSIARDAAFGGAVGLLAALLVLWGLGDRLQALGSDLIGSVRLGAGQWLLLAALPICGVLLAMLVARITILRALVRLT